MDVTSSILIVGAPGSGKSSVIQALSNLLAEAAVPHGCLEVESLAWGHPWLTLDETLPALDAALSAQRSSGRRTFLLTATPETDMELERLVASVGTPVVVVALRADPELAAARVLEREPLEWSGRGPLAEAARRLSDAIPRMAGVDLTVSTDGRTPLDTAQAIRRELAERSRGARRSG